MDWEKVYRDLFSSLNDGVVLSDKNQIIIDANISFLKMFGYEKEEILHKALDGLFSSDKDIHNDAEKITHDLSHENKIQAKTVRTDKYGKRIPVQIISFPVRENDEVVYFFTIYKDITEISNIEKKYKRIVDSLPEEIYAFNSKNMEEIISKNAKSIYFLLNDDDKNKIKDATDIISERKKTVNFITHIEEKTGELKWYRINIIYINEDEKLVILKDITIQKNSDEEKNRWNVFYNNLSLTIKDVLSSDLNENSYQKILDYAVASIPEIDGGSVLEKREDGLYHFVALTKNYDRKILMNITLNPDELHGKESDTIQITENMVSGNTCQITKDEKFDRLNEGHEEKKAIRAVISIPILFKYARMYIFLDSFSVSEFRPEVVKMGKIFAQQIEVLVKRLSLESEIKNQLQQLEFYSFNDPLTNLPNRRAFYKKINEVMKEKDVDRLNVVYFDLDGFKKINDIFGHEYGDIVLRKIGDLMIEKIDERIFFARIGGDEFIAYFINYSIKEINEIAMELIGKIENMKTIKEKCVRVSASYGISTYKKENSNINDLIAKADQNMYEQKRVKKMKTNPE